MGQQYAFPGKPLNPAKEVSDWLRTNGEGPTDVLGFRPFLTALLASTIRVKYEP